MNILKKTVAWLQVVVLCTVGGLSVGWAGDCILWEWSYDYVFPDGYCRVRGVQLGLLLGTVIAVASVVGDLPLLRWQAIFAGWIIWTLATTFIAFSVATVAWGLAKLGGVTRAADQMSALSRAAFCSALVEGAFYGAWISAALWSVLVWKQRMAALPVHSPILNEPPQDLDSV